jgi:hypothetical protein
MDRAFRVDHTFAALVELSDDDRERLVHQAIERADEMDGGEDETFVICLGVAGKDWLAYVDIGRRRVHVTSPTEAEKDGLPAHPPSPPLPT